MFLSRARNVVSGLDVGETVCNGGALPEFIAAFATLSLLFIGLVFLGHSSLGAAEVTDAKETATNSLTVEEFDRLRADHDLVVLDVRKPGEYFRGHIPGAINLDSSEKDFGEKLAALDKHHWYLIACNTERRTAEACEKLAKLHFKKIYTLKGGFDAWQEAGKPIEKSGAGKPRKN